MPSLQPIEANRRNAEKSTGPRSAEGKTASSLNALKTGIYAQTEVIRGENAADLQALVEDFYRDHQPASTIERTLVDQLVSSEWQLRRCRRIDAELFEMQFQRMEENDVGDTAAQAFNFAGGETFKRLQRRLDAAARTSPLAFNHLQRAQASRKIAGPPLAEPPPTLQPVEPK